MATPNGWSPKSYTHLLYMGFSIGFNRRSTKLHKINMHFPDTLAASDDERVPLASVLSIISLILPFLISSAVNFGISPLKSTSRPNNSTSCPHCTFSSLYGNPNLSNNFRIALLAASQCSFFQTQKKSSTYTPTGILNSPLIMCLIYSYTLTQFTTLCKFPNPN